MPSLGPPPKWIQYWLTFTIPVVLWDALGSLTRPWSLEGGPLFPIWFPYKFYGDKVDLIYGEKRWRAGDRFCEAQSVCNLGELFLQVVALYLLRKGAYSEAALVIIVTQAFTLWKTVLYWLYDIIGGLAHTGQNSPFLWIVAYAIPNGLWIVVPFFVVVHMCSAVLRALRGRAPVKTE